MAREWVQLKAARTIRHPDGRVENKQSGDWIAVSKESARRLIESGAAHIPDERKQRAVIGGDLSDCGISVRSEGVDTSLTGGYTLDVVHRGIALPFKRTLVWHPELPLVPDQIAHGFAKLEKQNGITWDMAVMLCHGDITMATIGSEEDRRETQELIGTLDVPVYESRAIWVRRNESTVAMAKAWRECIVDGVEESHAFMRALYKTPMLLVCTLPPMWLRNWYEEEQQAKQRKLEQQRARKRVKGRLVRANA
jgi:hypothetical protein